MDHPKYASLALPPAGRVSVARRVGLMALPALLLIGVVAFASVSGRHGVAVPRLPIAPGVKQEVFPNAVVSTSDGLLPAAPAPATDQKCSGKVAVGGLGDVSIVSADRYAPSMGQGASIVASKRHGRGYFADTCAAGPYNNQEYLALNPLGKTIRYTVDLAGAGCGCNVAFYLVSMHQNTAPSDSGDFYCDANGIGGVNCAEVDIQESNVNAWFTTLHVKDDINGAVIGYGGDKGKPDYRDWTRTEYGPEGRCIDTKAPFHVSTSFHTGDGTTLMAMELLLSQDGKECTISKRVENYYLAGRDPWAELTANLQDGMTPVVSYWVDKNMDWFDGPGQDGNGPCAKGADVPKLCPDSVTFSDFTITPIGA